MSCAPVRPDSMRRLGASYLTRREGILEARFEGTAYERGYARGALAYDQIVRGEKSVHDLIRRFFPSAISRFLLRRTVASKLRGSLPDFPEDRREEIVGLSDAIEPD